LVTIMRGLLSDLETWDLALDPVLKAHACFTPYTLEESHFCEVGGQPQSDWNLSTEVTSHNPTEDFLNEWRKHQAEANRGSGPSVT
jgi:hypothetical protein